MLNKRKQGSKGRSKLKSNIENYGYLFTAPFIIGFCLFVVVPLAQSIIFSFNKISITAGGYKLTPVGFENYIRLFTKDPYFNISLLNTVTSMIYSVPIIVMFAFFCASVLNQKFKGRLVVRAIFFLPIILAATTVLNLAVEQASAGVGGSAIHGVKELANSQVSVSDSLRLYFLSMGFPAAFMNYIINGIDRIFEIINMSGIQILLFLASLQSVPPSTLEAAKIEGANSWECFWKIIIPMVSPILLVGTVYTIIDFFTSTNTSILIVRIATADIHIGSAISWVYFVVVFAVIAIVYKALSKIVFYYE